MSEMVTRVARAMAEAAGFAWENCTQSQWERDARAGIAAMREPTEKMKDAGDALLDDTVECAHNVWNAMIDAALAHQ